MLSGIHQNLEQLEPESHDLTPQFARESISKQSQFALPKNKANNKKKRIVDLSRNLIEIVCEFLPYIQVLFLASSNQVTLRKLDGYGEVNGINNEENASYLKRRGIVYFQSFFFQQFPSADLIFKKRMNCLIQREASSAFGSKVHSTFDMSNKGEEQTTYLPLVKQASSVERHSMFPTLQKQESFSNPFDIASDYGNYKRGATVTTMFSDQPETNNYLNCMFNQWKDMYLTAIQNKKEFLKTHQVSFASVFLQDPTDFTREIFLDPSQCENPHFALPQLIRENFYQKGVFYRTEKILVLAYSNCFQHFGVEKTRQLLYEINQEMQTRIAINDNSRSALSSLINANPYVIDVAQNITKESAQSILPTQTELNNEPTQFQKALPQQMPFSFSLPAVELDDEDMLIDLEPIGNLKKPVEQSNFPLLSFPSLQKSNEDIDDDEALLAACTNKPLYLPTFLKHESKANIDEEEELTLPPMTLTKVNQPFSLDMSKLVFQPAPQIFPGPQGNYEMCKATTVHGIFSSQENLTPLYRDVASYQLRQYQLICAAHRNQLNFLLDQIHMAPSLNKNYFIYLEDYIEKERHLKYLLRKVSQNFIMQDAFKETILRRNVYQAHETNKKAYLSDFLMLEYLDSIWINEVYRGHREELTNHLIIEIQKTHTLEKFEDLGEKNDIFRKVINTIHQTEYSLANNESFLSISFDAEAIKNKVACPSVQLEKALRPSLFSVISQNGKSGCCSAEHQETVLEPMKNYDQLVVQMKASVKKLLSQMQKKSFSIKDFIDYCTRYEDYSFHKLQEVEHYYILMKKHYLGKTFARELAVKLENNKIAGSPDYEFGATASYGSAFSTNESYSGSSPSKRSKTNYQSMSLNQILHTELVESFFHQIVRRLLKNADFLKIMDTEAIMQSLFMLFHIEQNTRSEFACDINKYLTECHSQLQDLYEAQPDLISQTDEEHGQQQEESKQAPINSLFGVTGGFEVAAHEKFTSSLPPGEPFQSAIGESEESNDELMMNCLQQIPSLSRGYSAQKQRVFKGLSSLIFKEFLFVEKDFDFKKLIEIQKENERKRGMELIQQRIDSFNLHLMQFNAAQPIAASQIIPAPSQDEDDEMFDETHSAGGGPGSFDGFNKSLGQSNRGEDEESKNADHYQLLQPQLQKSSSSQQQFNLACTQILENDIDMPPIPKGLMPSQSEKQKRSPFEQIQESAMI